jgi:hypothetical protein
VVNGKWLITYLNDDHRHNGGFPLVELKEKLRIKGGFEETAAAKAVFGCSSEQLLQVFIARSRTI